MKEEKNFLSKGILDGFESKVPAMDFTQKVMDRIELEATIAPVIEPLIPAKFWKWIGISLLILIVLSSMVGIQESSIEWLNLWYVEYRQTIMYTCELVLLFGLFLGIEWKMGRKVERSMES